MATDSAEKVAAEMADTRDTAPRLTAEFQPITEVRRVGVTPAQERVITKKDFMAADMACFDSHLIRKANYLRRLRAKHAQKYGAKNE